MTYDKKKSLYENIMKSVAQIVKKRINESDEDSIYTHSDKFNGNFYSSAKVAQKFIGSWCRAYDPSIKGDPRAKDWNMYAVRISEIKEASVAYYGWRVPGLPSYVSSHMTLYGKLSIIKAGNGQEWEQEFNGKLEINYDYRNKRLIFKPYQFEGKYEELNSRSSKSFWHFSDRCVIVPLDKFDREVNADMKQKNLIEDLAKGVRSDNAIKYLIQNGYLKIEDGELKATKTD